MAGSLRSRDGVSKTPRSKKNYSNVRLLIECGDHLFDEEIDLLVQFGGLDERVVGGAKVEIWIVFAL
jgi:hypothetical protein